MNVAVLTTDTLHHAYFVREIAKRFSIERVLSETRVLSAPFQTWHPIEAARDEYENQTWFAGREAHLADFAECQSVECINDAAAVTALSQLQADVVLVFGTGRLHSAVLSAQQGWFLNLHGGDPEEYRGLDTHLWAIYHRDFAGLVTTLHAMTSELDDGDIILQSVVGLWSKMEMHQLRRANTEVCVELALSALTVLEERGELPCRPQRKRGRYYSFMPTPLKELCRKRFLVHTTGIVREPGHA